MSYLLFYIIFLSAVSLASASALLSDIFFFISLSHRRLKQNEIRNLRLLSGISTIATTCSIAAIISLMSINIANGSIEGEGVFLSLILMLTVAFFASLHMRNIHLPALKRQQNEYHHLSESFVHHQKSLISTSAVSIITWIFILTILSADAREMVLQYNSIEITLSYIIIAIAFSKMVTIFKKKIS